MNAKAFDPTRLHAGDLICATAGTLPNGTMAGIVVAPDTDGNLTLRDTLGSETPAHVRDIAEILWLA